MMNEQVRPGLGMRTVIGVVVALVLTTGMAACTSSGSDDAKPDDNKSRVVGSGDAYEATIRRTTDGIPHITGATIADAAFGQGFASGEDRSCDLADQVVKIRGERAKYFGPGKDGANIDSDVAWRAIGIFDRATKDWKSTAKGQVVKQFTAFADGWNTHLAEVGVDKISGWCKGADWVRPVKPVEIYAYARSVALTASSDAVSSFIPSAQPPGAPDATTSTTATPGAETSTTTATNATTSTTADSNPDAATSTTLAPDAGTPTTVAPASIDREAVGSQSPAPVSRATSTDGSADGSLAAMSALTEAPVASNGWAIGSARSANGQGMLLANPHFPWEGQLRFWEVQLTVPGTIDIYGSQLSGLPGVGIGFTKNFAWTHTVSAGNRFTAYKLDLVPGSPTKYRYGDEVRNMTPTDRVIEVKGDNGKITKETHTTWASQYGPIIDFPGFGWSDKATITFRDANIDNDEFLDQYLGMLQAKNLDEFIDVHEKVNGVPLFNTIATSADGRAWFADTSATPDLSPEAIAAYEATLESDPIVKIAADSGAVLLDGSDPKFEWIDEPGARDPGLVPAAKQPQVERKDYVFNANDSFWMPNATHMLEGDYSPLHGDQATPRSPRTRENAVMLRDTSASGPAGKDGKFTLDELADASLANKGYMADALLGDVVKRCEGVTSVDVPDIPRDMDVDGVPAASIDLTDACSVLSKWDGRYNLDSVGPPLWREFLSKYASGETRDAGLLWATPFDAAKPVDTPAGLAPVPPGETTDPVLVRLGQAVQTLKVGGFEPDAKLGETQFAMRNGKRIPIHGGWGSEGVTNVVGYGSRYSILDPALTGVTQEQLAPGSELSRTDGEVGYPVNNGTSFLLAVSFTKSGPQAKAFLTYGNTEDRKAKNYTAATERFSKKNWRDVAFTDAAIKKSLVSSTIVKG